MRGVKRLKGPGVDYKVGVDEFRWECTYWPERIYVLSSWRLSSIRYQVVQKAKTGGMFTQQFLSLGSHHWPPIQLYIFLGKAVWPLHSTRAASRRNGARDVLHVRYQAQSRRKIHHRERGHWITVYLQKLEGLVFLFLLSFQKDDTQAHNHSLWKTWRVQKKDLYTLTMTKLAALELSLLWSPLITSPIHAHGAF